VVYKSLANYQLCRAAGGLGEAYTCAGDVNMSVRILLPATILSFLAAAWCFPTIFHQPAESPKAGAAVTSRAEAASTDVLYRDLKTHVRNTITSVDESTDQWYERNAAHLGKSPLGRDVHRKVQAAMHREAEMVARWKAILQRMTDGKYDYAQALAESKKIDVESEALMAELRAIVGEMHQIQGCHCGG
jgi:hypothetical protein